MINKVILCGNLVADPKKGNAGDTKLLEFSIAVNEYRHGEEYANYFDCTIYGKRAEALASILHKGQKVTIVGKLSQNRWQAEDGKTRSKVSIVVDDLEFMSAKAQEAAQDEIPW